MSNKYIVCIWKRDPARWAQLWGNLALLKEHMLYFAPLTKKGVIVLGGPFVDSDGGLDIMLVDSIEEAKRLREGDPLFVHGVQGDAKYFELEVHIPPSKRLPEVHEKLQKASQQILGVPEEYF